MRRHCDDIDSCPRGMHFRLNRQAPGEAGQARPRCDELPASTITCRVQLHTLGPREVAGHFIKSLQFIKQFKTSLVTVRHSQSGDVGHLAALNRA